MSVNPHGIIRFKNKVAFVTGGASGIGRATALRLASEGAQVIIADKNAALGNQTVARIVQEGGDAVFIETDLTDDQSVKLAAQSVAAQVPALHILVNNA